MTQTHRKTLFLATTVLGGVAFAGPALAKAKLATAPPLNWSGCHIGGQAGGGWGRTDWSNFSGSLLSQLFGGTVIPVGIGPTNTGTGIGPTNTGTGIGPTNTGTGIGPTSTGTGFPTSGFITASRVNGFSDDTAGFLAGGEVGCDLQFAPHWVIGVEGQGEWAHISGTTNNLFTDTGGSGVIPGMFASAHSLTDWLVSLTASIGYTPWERWLVYAKGGAAWAGDKYSLTGSVCSAITTTPLACTTATPFAFGSNDTRVGWTAGLGIKYAFWTNWSWKLEYDFYDFGTETVTFNDALGNLGAGSASIKEKINVVTFGVDYNFWSGSGPKY